MSGCVMIRSGVSVKLKHVRIVEDLSGLLQAYRDGLRYVPGG